MSDIKYSQHLSNMKATDTIDDYPDAKIDEMYNALLQVLPNEGKLYKYRKFTNENDSFNNMLDSLSNGYMYIPKAAQLDDDFDTTLNHDMLEDSAAIKDYIVSHKIDILHRMATWYAQQAGTGEIDKIKLMDCIGRVLRCYDDQGKLNEHLACKELVKEGVAPQHARIKLKELLGIIDDKFSQHSEPLEQAVKDLININDFARDKTYVFSMSASHDIDSMWANYAGTNGFCIEYDYNKALELTTAERRILLSTYKVVYDDNKAKFSHMPMFEYYASGSKDHQIKEQYVSNMIDQILIKKSQWSNQQEWRIILNNIDNRQYVDIVRAVYIDERSVDTDMGQKLMKLAQQKGWGVYVRRCDHRNSSYSYRRI